MDNQAINKRAPTNRWYSLPVILLLAGPFISIYLIYSIYHSAVHTVHFRVPGISSIYIIKPGNYTLWTKIKNFSYSPTAIQTLQSIELTFTHSTEKNSFNLKPQLGWHNNEKGASHLALGTACFSKPGRYQVIAKGNIASPYQLYLRQPSTVNVFKKVAAAILITFISTMAALLSAIIIVIKQLQMRTAMTNQSTTLDTDLTPPITMWAMVCHLSGFAGFLCPIANIIAPLLIWGFKRHESAFLDDQGKEAINFQISITIYYVISALLIFIIIGLFLLPLLAAFHIIAMIIASIEAAHGKRFRYPLTIRFIR